MTFPEFIQTQKRYRTFLEKISILPSRILAISSQNFFFRTKLLKNLLIAKYPISAALALMFSIFTTKNANFYRKYV